MLTSGERNKVVPMHLRDAALMYSEILMRKDFIDKLPLNATAKLDRASKAILIQRPKEQKEQYSSMFYLNEDAFDAWCAWMGDDSVDVHRLQNADLPRLLQDLRFATAAVTHKTLARHPDLGDRYVSIRNDVLRSLERGAN